MTLAADAFLEVFFALEVSYRAIYLWWSKKNKTESNSECNQLLLWNSFLDIWLLNSVTYLILKGQLCYNMKEFL